MRILALTSLLALVACASPSIEYVGAEGVPVDIGDTRFTVFRNDQNVQAIRTSREVLPNKEEVFAKATIAIEQATGCEIRRGSLSGNQAVVEAKLNC